MVLTCWVFFIAFLPLFMKGMPFRLRYNLGKC